MENTIRQASFFFLLVIKFFTFPGGIKDCDVVALLTFCSQKVSELYKHLPTLRLVGFGSDLIIVTVSQYQYVI